MHFVEQHNSQRDIELNKLAVRVNKFVAFISRDFKRPLGDFLRP